MKKIVALFLLNFLVVDLAVYANVTEDKTPLAKNSIYHIKSEWRNQNNEVLQLRELAGQNVIITMVYTGCAHACPMTISKVEQIIKGLEKAGMRDFKLVLASFDAKRDTPENLKKYMRTRKLDEKRWIFLSAQEETIARELAVVLGISFKDLGDGDFSHSNVISFLDKNGVVKSKIESLTADIKPLVLAAQKEGK